jgi:hypothetical protein
MSANGHGEGCRCEACEPPADGTLMGFLRDLGSAIDESMGKMTVKEALAKGREFVQSGRGGRWNRPKVTIDVKGEDVSPEGQKSK